MTGDENLSRCRQYLYNLCGACCLTFPASRALCDIDKRQVIFRHGDRVKRTYPRTGSVPQASVPAGLVSAAGKDDGPAILYPFIVKLFLCPAPAPPAHNARKNGFPRLSLLARNERHCFSALSAGRDTEVRRDIGVCDYRFCILLAPGEPARASMRMGKDIHHLLYFRVDRNRKLLCSKGESYAEYGTDS